MRDFGGSFDAVLIHKVLQVLGHYKPFRVDRDRGRSAPGYDMVPSARTRRDLAVYNMQKLRCSALTIQEPKSSP